MKKSIKIISFLFGTFVSITAITKIVDAIDVISDFGTKHVKNALVISRVKKIAKLTTSIYKDQFVVTADTYEPVRTFELLGNSSNKKKDTLIFTTFDGDGVYHPNVAGYKSTNTDYCYIINSTTRIGYDFSDCQIEISGDSLTIFMPEIEVLDVVINPRDYRIYGSKDMPWEQEKFMFSKVKGMNMKKIENSPFMDRSEELGKKQIENILSGLGYKVGIVTTPRSVLLKAE